MWKKNVKVLLLNATFHNELITLIPPLTMDLYTQIL